MAVAIHIEGLTKVFEVGKSQVTAVDHLNLDVNEGEIFGFLGPNGAGKTTTIKMLLGLIFPTAGSATILGKDIGDIQVKREISYLPESPYFYDHLTGRELLDFYGRLFGLSAQVLKQRTDELLELVGLADAGEKSLRQYSKGMMQRIGIAQALINDPKILFLDEPTSGLDAIARIEVRRIIQRLKEQGGKTVFLSSHQLLEVELVCDRVSIMNRGQLVRVGNVEQLLVGSDMEIIGEGIPEEGLARIRALVPDARTQDGRLTAVHSDEEIIGQIIDIVRAHKGHIISLTPQRRTLEDLFVQTFKEEVKA